MVIENGNVVQFNGDLKFKVNQIIDEAYEKGYQKALKDFKMGKVYQKGYDACKIEHEYKELISNNESISEVLNNLYKDIDNYYHECLLYCAEQDQKCRNCISTTFGRILAIINNYKDPE